MAKEVMEIFLCANLNLLVYPPAIGQSADPMLQQICTHPAAQEYLAIYKLHIVLIFSFTKFTCILWCQLNHRQLECFWIIK
jgi:hypothetical protein